MQNKRDIDAYITFMGDFIIIFSSRSNHMLDSLYYMKNLIVYLSYSPIL